MIHSICETCVDAFCLYRNQYTVCPKIPPVITTTTDGSQTWQENLIKASEKLGEDFGKEIGKIVSNKLGEYRDLAVKASRLAESVLMDWDKAEQVELAKEVAIMTKNLLNRED